jgi:excisionase family DNA binding protein
MIKIRVRQGVSCGAEELEMEEQVLAVSVIEAARRLGISARTVATLVARNELRSRKIGRRRVIPVGALEQFLRRDHPSSNETVENNGAER